MAREMTRAASVRMMPGHMPGFGDDFETEALPEALPYGPDEPVFEGGSNAELAPHQLDNTMSFMFETRFPQHLTAFAAHEAPLQDDYIDCRDGLQKTFDGTPGVK